MNNIEYRVGSVVINDETKMIGGLAIVAESRSELLGDCFYEVISKRALEGLIEKNDIRLLINHEPQKGTVARSKFGKGSLKLELTERGLEFSTECPNTQLGNELYEGLRRGDFDACSFAFRVGKDNWKKNSDGTYLRTIESFEKVFEISCLSEAPAYSATECGLRSLEAFKAQEKRAEEDAAIEEGKKKAEEEAAKKAEEEKKAAELKEYYDKLKKSLD